MSSSDVDPQLAEWLLKLDQYSDAINSSSDAFQALETQNTTPSFCSTQCEESTGQIMASAPIADEPIGRSENAIIPSLPPLPSLANNSVSLVEHLPIDGLLKSFHRSKSYVLGIGSIGQADRELVHSIVSEFVTRCSIKTDRKAILVSIEPTNRIAAEIRQESGCYRTAVWTAHGESKANSKAWHAQLASLPRWKREFGLIVLDLGDACCPRIARFGRLCDGVVVQLFSSVGSRETIRTLKSLQKEGISVLGGWSVGLGSHKLSA